MKSVLTRRQQREEHKKQRFKKLLMIKLKVHKFTNPFETYKICDNFCIQQKDRQPILSLSTFFLWNKITEARQLKDSLILQLNPHVPQAQISPQYLINRLRSFGDKELNDFALKVQHLLSLNLSYTPELISQFAKPKEITEKITQPSWLLITGDYLQNKPRQTHMQISKQMVKALGFTPEQLMLLSVKSGIFPIESESKDIDYYHQMCTNYLSLLLMYQAMATHKQSSAIKTLATISFNEVRIPVKSANGVTAGVQFSLSFLSPVDVLFIVKEVIKKPKESQPEVDERYLLDDEQQNLLNRLTKVPQSCCKRAKHRICKYKRI